jgi:hypothetical protein
MDKIEPKYKLTRTSDGTVPDWPYFVLGARDPAANAAMQAYLIRITQLGYSEEYIDTVDAIADQMEDHFSDHAPSDVGQPRTLCLNDLAVLCAEAEDALRWCSGSDDFAPGGKAELGWKRGPAALIEKLRAAREQLSPNLPVLAKPEP